MRHFATLTIFVFGLLTALPAGAASVSVRVTDGSGKALPDAVIYALPASGKAPLKAAPTALIDQVNKEFAPLVSVMQTGTVVSFPNKDNIRHQVYSFSPAKPFELRLYSGTQAAPVTFDKPGVVTLGCNIHDHMIAHALIVDTPWFAKTGPSGGVIIDGLPAGDYDIHGWHHRQTSPTGPSQRITIKGPASSDIALKIELKPG